MIKIHYSNIRYVTVTYYYYLPYHLFMLLCIVLYVKASSVKSWLFWKTNMAFFLFFFLSISFFMKYHDVYTVVSTTVVIIR